MQKEIKLNIKRFNANLFMVEGRLMNYLQVLAWFKEKLD